MDMVKVADMEFTPVATMNLEAPAMFPLQTRNVSGPQPTTPSRLQQSNICSSHRPQSLGILSSSLQSQVLSGTRINCCCRVAAVGGRVEGRFTPSRQFPFDRVVVDFPRFPSNGAFFAGRVL